MKAFLKKYWGCDFTRYKVFLFSPQFACARFKEISTRESVEEVAEVFEHSCRQGWLFRQHRELIKHRNIFISASSPSTCPSSSGGAGAGAKQSSFEKSISLDSR